MHEAVSVELIYLLGVSVTDRQRGTSQKTPHSSFRWPCLWGCMGSQTHRTQGKGVACVFHSLVMCEGCYSMACCLG